MDFITFNYKPFKEIWIHEIIKKISVSPPFVFNERLKTLHTHMCHIGNFTKQIRVILLLVGPKNINEKK